MSDTHLDLPEDLERFVQREIMDGRFASTAEVIKAGLALLEERETRLAALRSTIAESERTAADAFITASRSPLPTRG